MAGIRMPHGYVLSQRSINRLVTQIRRTIVHSELEIELRKAFPLMNGMTCHLTQEQFWPYVAEELYALNHAAVGREWSLIDYEYSFDAAWQDQAVQFLKTLDLLVWNCGQRSSSNLYQWLEKFSHTYRENIKGWYVPGQFEDLYFNHPWE